MKVLALIPARSGSKGVKDKNIRFFKDKPLIAHTILSALQSQICDEVFVCTDSEKYAKIAQDFGANVPFLRSKENARDESKSIDCVLESIQRYKELGRTFDILLLLQPTSPLRGAKHIQEAYELFVKNHYQSLLSVCKSEVNPLFIRTLQNHQLSPILSQNSSVRRQDLQTFYRLNGAIYLNLISTLTTETSFNDNVIGYVMEEKYSLDIDTLQDFKQ